MILLYLTKTNYNYTWLDVLLNQSPWLIPMDSYQVQTKFACHWKKANSTRIEELMNKRIGIYYLCWFWMKHDITYLLQLIFLFSKCIFKNVNLYFRTNFIEKGIVVLYFISNCKQECIHWINLSLIILKYKSYQIK